MNPDQQDTNPKSISFFHGYGRDGSGDGIADRNNDLDVLAAMATLMSNNGNQEENLQINLWNYYQNSRSVERIKQFATIYATLRYSRYWRACFSTAGDTQTTPIAAHGGTVADGEGIVPMKEQIYLRVTVFLFEALAMALWKSKAGIPTEAGGLVFEM